MKQLPIVLLVFLVLSLSLVACLGQEQPLGAATGSVTVGSFLKTTAAVSLTMTAGTNNKAYTVLGSWQPITATNATTPSFSILAAGTNYCLVNVGTARIWITDKTTVTLSTSYHLLEQNDVLCGHSDGTQFIETSFTNN